MTEPYASMPRRREPLSDEDRQVLTAEYRNSTKVARVFAVFTGVGSLLAVAGATAAEPGSKSWLCGVMAAVLASITVWALLPDGRGKARAAAVEKVVYVGVLSGKRAERIGPSQAEAPDVSLAQYVHFIALDGVEFPATRELYDRAEIGRRVSLHCLGDHDVFRLGD